MLRHKSHYEGYKAGAKTKDEGQRTREISSRVSKSEYGGQRTGKLVPGYPRHKNGINLGQKRGMNYKE